MSVKAWRQWRVKDDGTLCSLYHPVEWPVVLRAGRPPTEFRECVVVQHWDRAGPLGPHNMEMALRFVEGGEVFPVCVCAECAETANKNGLGWPAAPKPGDILKGFDMTGIYAVRSPKDYYNQWYYAGPLAQGQVELFGHIVEHERGYRAEAALVCGPLELLRSTSLELAKRVGDKYECEVTVAQEDTTTLKLNHNTLANTLAIID